MVGLRKLPNPFRILRGWEVFLCKDKKVTRRVVIHGDIKQAVIFDWHGKNRPDEFLFHEFTHIALYEFRRLYGDRITKASKRDEEYLIHDICALGKVMFKL